MQNLVALVIVCGAILMVFILGGRLALFSDFYGGLFLFLFTYSATVIAFVSQGLYKSVIGLRYLFVNDIAQTPASEFLAIILKKQISFIYGGASLALLIGSVSIFSSAEALASTTVIYNAFAINILIILYAAIFSEGLLRPLPTKLEKRLSTIK